ncbi:MAG: DUF962 domain-containing protein [Deltaproteobacteria bacterium]|nr:DUF962 domain-containing protein [Deltaproteobacteria bacterium]
MFGRPMTDWIAEYSQGHQHPVNRACHTIGIPMIALSVIVAIVGLAGLFVPGSFLVTMEVSALTLFVVGWVFQFIGHGFEGKPPEFFKDWRFLLVGLRWWFAKMAGRA